MTTPCNEANIGNLIDLSPEEEKQVEGENEFSNSDEKTDELCEKRTKSEHESPPSASETKNYSRLCGYLNKLGNQKILKTFRRRWFVFNEGNCKLYYYRSPHDQVPLGEIDISLATFSFEVANKDRSCLFTISVPGRDYFLEANNRQTCLFWLQELQKYRRANSIYRTKIISDDSTSANDLTGRPQSGLLGQMLPDVNNETSANSHMSLMKPVDCPKDVIGDDSASSSANPLSNAQQKLNVFYNQLKSSASFSKYDKPLLNSSPNSPDNENLCSQDITPHAPLKPTRSGGSHQKTKYQNLSSFKSKLSHSFRKNYPGEEKSIDESDQVSKGDHCSRCVTLEKKIENLTDENSNLNEEVTTSREVRSLLQRQIDIASKEKDTLIQIYQLDDKEQNLKLLCEKDQQIVNLTHDMKGQQQEVENLQRHVISLKSEVADLSKNNELFQEMLIQKDKTIMTLTNEVFDLETEKRDERRKSSCESLKSDTISIVEQRETLSLDDLKDAVQAFELQNKFLNNEILELNKLRRDSEERVRLLSIKCSEWEARSYQIQSKLLYLLNELKQNGASNLNEDTVNQLLQEAMGDGTAHTNLIPSWSREKRYDDLGFNWRWGKDDLLSLKASNLKQKSEDMTNKANDSELLQWRTKWDNFMVSLGSKELQRSQELKTLVRMGIPHEYRGRIWKECALMWIKHYKASFESNYYNSLLTSGVYNTKLDPYAKQIELDLLRTLPNNMHYESLDSDGVPKLRRVLLGFSRHNPDIGYCQGLNRLAAIALLFMEEEDAFWCLIAITKKIMPDYYSQTLIGSHVDQKVLKDLMADKLPRLHSHLEQNNVDLSLFTFNWFFTVFVDNIPVDTYLRIWDVFLCEGSKVLFRYALAILKLCESEILLKKDYLSINKCLRSISDLVIDAKKLTHIAFNELNPFSIKTIASKRVQHYPIIETQIQELVSMRNSLSRNKEKNSTADYLSEED